MDKLNVNTIEPEGATTTLNVGISGKSVIITDNLKANTLKDAGGNTIFTSDGSGNVSSVNSGFGSAQVLLSTQTASDSASLSFTSDIDSTYKEYVFEFINIGPATDDAYFTFQVNATDSSGYDRTMTTTYFDAYHTESDSSALDYRAAYDQAQGTAFQTLMPYMGNGSDEAGCGELHLFNPSSTTYVKNFYVKTQYYYSANASYSSFVGGYINDTTAIDDVQFKMSSGNFDGKIKMYGIK
jgi:hypothetical protein